MSKFNDWYEQHKAAIHLLASRQDVAFYVWNNKPKSAQRSAKITDQYSKDFEDFWVDYPNKIGKGAAWLSWQKLKPPIIDCLETLAWQRKTQQWTNENGKYIPYPCTWLNQRRWEDEPPRSASESGGKTYTDMNGCVRVRS